MTKINGMAIEEMDTVGERVGLRNNCAAEGRLFRAACDAALVRRGESRDEGFRQQIQTDLLERRARRRARK